MNDGNAPLYSVTILTSCPLNISLRDGYLLALALRTLAAPLFAAMFYALSFWIKTAQNLLFTALCVLIVPMFLDNALRLFTHAGLLSSTQMLTILGKSGIFPAIPLAVMAVYSLSAVVFARRRHQKGL